VVCQQNDWSNNVSLGAKHVKTESLTNAKQLQLEFWTAFREFVLDQKTIIKPRKPQPQVWMSFSIGRAGIQLTAVASTWDSAKENYDSSGTRNVRQQCKGIFRAAFRA
jgi:hypothetical protein